jgi:hypothetical protein
MPTRWQTFRRLIYAPLGVAIALTWLAVILHIVIGEVTVRETTVGGFLARQIDRLPTIVARPIYTTLWFSLFLGWIVPLFLGLRRLFRRNEASDTAV